MQRKPDVEGQVPCHTSTGRQQVQQQGGVKDRSPIDLASFFAHFLFSYPLPDTFFTGKPVRVHDAQSGL